MYDVGGKLLSVSEKEGKNEWFRIDSKVKQGCIISPNNVC